MKKILVFAVMVVMAGIVGHVSKYTIVEWEYWVTVVPVCAWLGVASGALATYYD